MKNLNKLAAAVALTFAAGGASAAINTGFGFNTNSAVPSSILFSAIDDTTNQTFVLNLALSSTSGFTDLNYTDFVTSEPGRLGLSSRLNDAGSLTWDLSSYAPFAGFTISRWSVLGGYEFDNVALTNGDKLGAEPEFDGLYADQFNSQWGALVTAPSTAHLNPNDQGSLLTNPSGTGTTGKYLAAVKQEIGNADVASIAPVNGVAFYDTKVFGWQGTLRPGVLTVRGAGDSEFIWATNPFADGKNQFTTLGTFSLGTDNRLTLDVAAVPVPGAVWLFGSVLVGFLGMSRRKLASALAA
jgi:hypothetical protein